jgi:PAS domain S-box-containing protein
LQHQQGASIGAPVPIDSKMHDGPEQTFQETQKRLQAEAGWLGLGCYSWDAQSNDLTWDASVKAMWGLPPEAELSYDAWLGAIHPDDRGHVRDAVAAPADPGCSGIYDAEYRVTGINDGIVRWIATRGKTTFAAGKPVGFLGIALDITSKKLAENQLIADRKELAQANARLQIELAEAGSQRNRLCEIEGAEATPRQGHGLEVIGHLAAGLAHDFNNILSVIRANANYLLDLDDLEMNRLKQCLNLMKEASERGADITRKLLAFANGLHLEPAELDINRFLKDMETLFRSTIGSSISYEALFANALGPAFADQVQLEMAMLNIILNARDAMPSGGTLKIKTGARRVGQQARTKSPGEPEAGNYIVISIADSGTGMTSATVDRVFEPKKCTKSSEPGLAQAFSFLKRSGGGIRIDTKAGSGTTVHVYLPAAGDENKTMKPSGRG